MNIKKRKKDEVPRAVNQEVISELLSLPDQSTFGGLRDYALLVLTMDAGIRPSEATGLKIKGLNLTVRNKYTCGDRQNKGIPNLIYISTVTVEALMEQISELDGRMLRVLASQILKISSFPTLATDDETNFVLILWSVSKKAGN